jgi:DNA-binding response OmpR family regulator
MRILIAGEDEALARLVRQGLEGESYTVDVLPDGEQARNAATEFEYDAVILDLNLPKLDGVSVFGAGSDAAYSGRRPGAASGSRSGRLHP